MYYQIHPIMLLPNLLAQHGISCFKPDRNGLHQPFAPCQPLVNADLTQQPCDDDLQLGFALAFLGLYLILTNGPEILHRLDSHPMCQFQMRDP